MTNLEAKQEAIKKAYGENFTHTDKNGWIRYLTYRPSDLGIEYYDYMDGFWRCKSLKGIENNNGWVKIESEKDLPKKDGWFYVYRTDNSIIISEFVLNFKAWNFYEGLPTKAVTHYKPIEKPKPPIF